MHNALISDFAPFAFNLLQEDRALDDAKCVQCSRFYGLLVCIYCYIFCRLIITLDQIQYTDLSSEGTNKLSLHNPWYC